MSTYRISFHSLQCLQQQETDCFEGHEGDEVKLRFNNVLVFDGSMQTGDLEPYSETDSRWKQPEEEFEGIGQLQIAEEDDADFLDDDDWSNTWDVQEVPGTFGAIFELSGGAKYQLLYTVEQTESIESDGDSAEDEAGSTTAEDTTDAEDDTDAALLEGASSLFAGDVGDPVANCPLATLTVAVRTCDGEALPGATVVVAQLARAGTTGEDGYAYFGEVLAGTYTIEAWREGYYPDPACREIEVACQEDKYVDLVLSDVYIQYVLPDKPTDNDWGGTSGVIKQYINLDPDEEKHQGRDVTISAVLSKPTDNVTVYFKLETANRAGLPADMQTSLQWTERESNFAGIAETKLRLCTYGRTGVRVWAGLTPDFEPGSPGSLATVWIIVYRKVYAYLSGMERGHGTLGAYFDLGRVQGQLDNQGIELVNMGPGPDRIQNDRVTVGDEMTALTRRLQRNLGSRECQIVFVETVADDEQFHSLDGAVNGPKGTIQSYAPNDPKLTGRTLDPTDWFVSATLRDATGKRVSYHSSTGNWVKVFQLDTDDPKFPEGIEVDVDAAGLDWQAGPVDVDLYVVSCNAKWGGMQDGKVLYIAVGAHIPGGGDLSKTILHEFGHMSGLALDRMPDGTLAPIGSDGCHCANQSEGCLMHADGTTAFCSYCADALRGVNLSKVPVDRSDPY